MTKPWPGDHLAPERVAFPVGRGCTAVRGVGPALPLHTSGGLEHGASTLYDGHVDDRAVQRCRASSRTFGFIERRHDAPGIFDLFFGG